MSEDDDLSVADAVVPDTSRPVDSDADLDRLEREQGLRDREEEITLRRRYGKWALIGAAIQLGITDVVFIVFGATGLVDVTDRLMAAWLAATVVQVIAVVLVITRSLFPQQRHRAGARD